MTTTQVSAVNNPSLANKLVEEALSQVEQAPVKQKVATPPDTSVTLSAGVLDPIDGLIMTAEVRELTGADEEAIAKASDTGKALLTILDRAVVKVGDHESPKDLMDVMLAGDRELLLLTIRRVTFGDDVIFDGVVCPNCTQPQKITVLLNKDVKIKELEGGTTFSITGKAGDFEVALPNGIVQKTLINSALKTTAELDTLVLKGCIKSINGKPLMDVEEVRNLSIKDRRDILQAISDRNPGPQLSEVTKQCPSCGSEVPLPLTLAELFQ